jgi:hypothetical protein
VTPLPPGGQYQQGLSVVLFNGSVTAGLPQAVSLGGDPITIPGLSAVVINVIASNATTASAVQIAVNQQVVQSVAAPAGQVDSNLIFVAIPPSLSQAALSVTAGTVDVELDFVGFVTGPKQFSNHGGMLHPIQSTVLFDGGVTPGSTTQIPVLGKGDVPTANVAQVLLNVTVSGSTAVGSLALEASALALWFPPPANSLGFATGQTTANRAIVAVGTDGAIALLDRGAGANVRVEALGWFTSAADTNALGSLFSPTAAVRLFDSALIGGPVAAGSSISFAVRGQGGVPSSASSAPPTAAMFQVTAVSPQGAGSISVAGSPAIDFTTGQTTSGLVVSPLGSDGSASFSVSGAVTNLTIDLIGYFSGDIIVPGSTKVLTPALLAAITGIGSDYTVTFAPGTQVSPFIQLNDVIVAGISPTTPTGFLLRVLSITTFASGTVAVGTRIARLPEALTAFTLDWSLPPTAGLFGAARTSVGPAATHAGPSTAMPLQSSSNPFPPPVGTSIDPKYPNFAIASPGSSIQFLPAPWAQLSIDDLEVQALPHFHFEYNFFNNTVKAAFAFSVGVRIALSDTITKDFSVVALELYHHQFFIGPRPQFTMLGNVPVVYWPEVTVTLNFDASISVGLSTTYHLDKWAQATVSYDGSQWHAGQQTVEYANGFDPPNVIADAQAKLSLHVIPGIQFYLVLTSGTDISPFIKATVTPNTLTPPWWQLSAGICIGVAETLDLILVKASYSQQFACIEIVLLHAPGLKLNVAISPTAATVPRFKTQHFQAGVPNSSKGVIWSVVGGNASGTLSNSSVTDTDYTAPGVPGTYQVKAAAIDDPSSYITANVTVPAGTPSSPSSVTALARPASAVVTWAPPSDTGGVPITGYDVTDVQDGTHFHVGGNTLTLTVPNLTPGSTHTFTVTATNQAGLTSAPSAPSAPIIILSAGPMSVAPTTLDFGAVTLGQTSLPKTVTVNAGGSQLLVNSVAMNGAQAGNFGIQSDLCSGKTLAPSTSCTFAVVYKPVIRASVTASVQVTDSDKTSPQAVTVTGTSPVPTTPRVERVADIQMVDLQHGFLADSNGIMATVNGGATWVRQKTPADVQFFSGQNVSVAPGSLRFIDANHGWALACRTATTPCTPLVIGTSDGGQTWLDLGALPANLNMKQVWFADLQHGWVMGSLPGTPPSTYPYATGTNALYATADGGSTWNRQTLPDPLAGPSCPVLDEKRFTGSIGFVDALHGWATNDSTCFQATLPFSQTGHATFAWSTSDGGVTWTVHTLAADLFIGATTPIQVVGPSQIRFGSRTANNGFYEDVLVTTNDGANFSTIHAFFSAYLAFLDATHGIGVSFTRPDVFTTSDGGNTWVDIGIIPDFQDPTGGVQNIRYYRISAVDGNNIWVAGTVDYANSTAGFVSRSTDGGLTWTVQLLGDGT